MQDHDQLDALDAPLNPYGRHMRHLAEHAGTIPARLDEFGRCAYCVRRGWCKTLDRLRIRDRLP
jgi:hypothetical protein